MTDAASREPHLAEYRIAEDARVATDAPIDLLVGLLASVLTAVTLVAVLWRVGGSWRWQAVRAVGFAVSEVIRQRDACSASMYAPRWCPMAIRFSRP